MIIDFAFETVFHYSMPDANQKPSARRSQAVMLNDGHHSSPLPDKTPDSRDAHLVDRQHVNHEIFRTKSSEKARKKEITNAENTTN